MRRTLIMTIKFQTSINVKSVCYLFQKSPSFNATCGITSEMTRYVFIRRMSEMWALKLEELSNQHSFLFLHCLLCKWRFWLFFLAVVFLAMVRWWEKVRACLVNLMKLFLSGQRNNLKIWLSFSFPCLDVFFSGRQCYPLVVLHLKEFEVF